MAQVALEDGPQGLGWTLSLQSNALTAHLRPVRATPAAELESQNHWALDLEAVLVEDRDTPSSSTLVHLDENDLHDDHSSLFTTHLFAALASGKSKGLATVLRLLFPKVSGAPIRSDFLEYRFKGYEYAHTVRSFLKPLTPVTPASASQSHHVNSTQTFVDFLGHSMGGIIAQSPIPKNQGPPELTRHLDAALHFRLSVPYLLSNTPSRRRIFWVQGRANIVASHQFYQAAHALGLTLVVLDVPGHWMEDPSGPHAHYREAFIPLNIDADPGLAQRIVDAVHAYPHPVDGIVSISDMRLPLVARACEILGLPTEPAEAYRIAGDKGETRKLETEAAASGDESFVLQSAQELESVLKSREGGLEFPLVVKPCTGWNSDCVVKVRNVEELRTAVYRASDRHKDSAASNTGVVVEPYIDGPEVDADFVILDGQVVFSNIVDDFPCSGDLIEGTLAANFMETLMDVPSALPEEEKALLRESLSQSIARCGFKSGVFHLEARVRGSRAHYAPRKDNGLLDLQIREEGTSKRAPSAYLHEINARTPGYANCAVTLLAHGVDYYALRLLSSLGPDENERIKVLAVPFLNGQPQYTSGIAVLPPTRPGIMGSEDAVAEFFDANPDLLEHIAFQQNIVEKGQVVYGPDSSELWNIGFVIVVSRKDRKDWIEIATQVRDRFDYKLLDE